MFFILFYILEKESICFLPINYNIQFFWNLLFLINDSQYNLFFFIVVFFYFFFKKFQFFKLSMLLVFLFFLKNENTSIFDFLFHFWSYNLTLTNGLALIHPFLVYYLYIFFLYYIIFQKNLLLLKQWYIFILVGSISLILGSWWAQQELNWGGWWNWDFVELILFIFFLKVVIFNHLYLKKEKFLFFFFKNNFFYFVCFFIFVRWDIISSVHSFNSISFFEKFSFYFLTLIFFYYIYVFVNKVYIYNKLQIIISKRFLPLLNVLLKFLILIFLLFYTLNVVFVIFFNFEFIDLTFNLKMIQALLFNIIVINFLLPYKYKYFFLFAVLLNSLNFFFNFYIFFFLILVFFFYIQQHSFFNKLFHLFVFNALFLLFLNSLFFLYKLEIVVSDVHTFLISIDWFQSSLLEVGFFFKSFGFVFLQNTINTQIQHLYDTVFFFSVFTNTNVNLNTTYFNDFLLFWVQNNLIWVLLLLISSNFFLLKNNSLNKLIKIY